MGVRAINSVAKAKDLTRQLGALLTNDPNWKGQVNAVHRKITSEHFDYALRDLTWNRVKAWYYAEARRIDYEEIVALEELKALEEARRDHREFVATTNRMAAALAKEGAPLSRKQLAVLEGIAREQAARAGGQAEFQGDTDAASRGKGGGMAVTGVAA